MQNLRREQALDAKKAIQLALDSRLDELKMDHAMAAVRQAKTVWVGFWEGLLLRVFEAVVHVKLLGSYFSIVQKKQSEVPLITQNRPSIQHKATTKQKQAFPSIMCVFV